MKNIFLAGGAFRVITAILLATSCWNPGADWTQYRGPNHDGISTDRILSSWSPSSPPVRWRIPFQHGYSSFTASQGRVFTKDRRTVDDQDEEFCLALNADTGAELWAVSLGACDSDRAPTTTPILDGDRVYVLTTQSRLSCLSAETGGVLWARDLAQTLLGQTADAYNVGSPTVEGDWVFAQTGGGADLGRLIALRKTDGELAWMLPAGGPTYATPIAITILGVRQVIFSTDSGLVSVAPASAEILWRFPCAYLLRYATPVVSDDIVIASDSQGAVAIQISRADHGFVATKIWSSTSFGRDSLTTPVCYQGFLYGITGNELICVDVVTGKVQWRELRFNDSGVLIAEGKILAFNAARQLILAEANPARFVQLAAVPVRGLTADELHNHPAVYNSRIYARSRVFGVCLDFAVERPAAPAKTKWEFVAAMNGGSIPAIGADGTVYFGARDQRIYALDGISGTTRWESKLGSSLDTSVAIDRDGTLYVAGSSNTTVYALDPAAGTVKWSAELADTLATAPVIGADGTIYVTSMNGRVFVLDGATGTELWEFADRSLLPARSSLALGTDGSLYAAFGERLSALESGSPGGLMASPWPAPRGNARNTGRVTAFARPDESNVVASNFVGLVLRPMAGAAIELQSADTLGHPLAWRRLADIPSSTTPCLFIDPTAPNRNRRFYRAAGKEPLGIGLFPGWTFTAPVGSRYRIEYVEPQTSPTNWRFLADLTLTNSPCLFIDTTDTNRAPRSYRTSPLD